MTGTSELILIIVGVLLLFIAIKRISKRRSTTTSNTSGLHTPIRRKPGNKNSAPDQNHIPVKNQELKMELSNKCSYCYGTGYAKNKCPFCSGGFNTCTRCGGSGGIMTNDIQFGKNIMKRTVCTSCGGSARQRCMSCGGMGTRTSRCTQCNGTGFAVHAKA